MSFEHDEDLEDEYTGQEIEDDEFDDEFDETVVPFDEQTAEDEAQEFDEDEDEDEEDEGESEAEAERKRQKEISQDNAEGAEGLVELCNVGIAFIIATLIAKSNTHDKYLLPPKSEKKIIRALMRIIPKDKLVFNKWFMLGTVIAAAYTPVISEAMKDRKTNIYQHDLEKAEHERQIEEIKSKKAAIEAQNAAAKAAARAAEKSGDKTEA